MEITKNNMQSLLNMIPSIPHEIQVKFTKNYGRLLDLMRVTVNKSALSALGQYRNPDLRIFELPHLDTCPNIEEYESLLKMKIPKLDLVYHHSNLDVSERKLLNLLKLKPKSSDRVECREHKELKRKFLEKCLNELIQQQDWDDFMPLYALTIYGLLLFPYLVDVIDLAAMEVFYKFEKLGANPVSAILAETFLSMQEWRQTT
ncbi:hypothetical protein RIF29_00560 [Crotalaria pallida]|uniref:DUF7745 domain-containing protein n=1 Tax=Crotalaria pallida TaxID=3830 RepID=A0AAN9IWS0_CROPI